MNNIRRLLTSTAFSNEDVARYKQTPDTTTLVQTINAMSQMNTVLADDILKRSPDIAWMVPYWDQTDAIVEGYAAIKAAAEAYLPRFNDEADQEYKTRLSLTKFTNVYRDIVEGLASKPFEAEIALTDKNPPQEIKDFIEDVDGSGNNLTVFSAATFFNGINAAIDWIFVDYPVDNGTIKSVADQKAAGIRPFWQHVLGRNVLEARQTQVNGKMLLTYIRIFEPGIGKPDHVRIMEMDTTTQIVTWTLFQKSTIVVMGSKSQFVKIDQNTLSIKEIPLVPFITGRRDGSSWKIYPSMRDAADLQIELYQTESALKFISTMAGYPMLAANGMRPQMSPDGKTPVPVKIGPMKMLWGIPDGNGNAGSWSFIEPSGTSMTFLRQLATDTKSDLRELGRQPLTAQSGNLTVITTAVAAGKSKSAVVAWTINLKDSIENALRITADWMGIPNYEPEVSVYDQFDDILESRNDLQELGAARVRGDLSRQTYWAELKRRDVLDGDFNAEEEEELLLGEMPGDPDIEGTDDLPPGSLLLPPTKEPAIVPPPAPPAPVQKQAQSANT